MSALIIRLVCRRFLHSALLFVTIIFLERVYVYRVVGSLFAKLAK